MTEKEFIKGIYAPPIRLPPKEIFPNKSRPVADDDNNEDLDNGSYRQWNIK